MNRQMIWTTGSFVAYLVIEIVLLVNPFSTQTTFLAVLGIGLVASGLTDFVVDRVLAAKMKLRKKISPLRNCSKLRSWKN